MMMKSGIKSEGSNRYQVIYFPIFVREAYLNSEME